MITIKFLLSFTKFKSLFLILICLFLATKVGKVFFFTFHWITEVTEVHTPLGMILRRSSQSAVTHLCRSCWGVHGQQWSRSIHFFVNIIITGHIPKRGSQPKLVRACTMVTRLSVKNLNISPWYIRQNSSKPYKD